MLTTQSLVLSSLYLPWSLHPQLGYHQSLLTISLFSLLLIYLWSTFSILFPLTTSFMSAGFFLIYYPLVILAIFLIVLFILLKILLFFCKIGVQDKWLASNVSLTVSINFKHLPLLARDGFTFSHPCLIRSS